MKFKNYQFLKVKYLLKNKSILLISNGTNQKNINWIKFEQFININKFNYLKLSNKIIKKIFKKSLFSNFKNLIYGPLFFLIPNNKIILSNKFFKKEVLEFVKFKFLALKLNKKIYSIKQIEKINSYIYIYSIIVFYQFLIIHLKFLLIFSKQCDLNTRLPVPKTGALPDYAMFRILIK